MVNDTVTLVFAKAPIEGQVNTRLISGIGKQAATQLQYDLVHQRLTMLTQAKLGDVILMCLPDIKQKFFIECQEKYSVNLRNQLGNDLGERMSNGVSEALKSYRHCIVVGTDAPALDGRIIQQAIETLREKNSVVFVPAEDGGYVLVGMNQLYNMLFQNIDWGTPEVMQQSRGWLEENSISYDELETCWDIDRLEDYQRYLEYIKV